MYEHTLTDAFTRQAEDFNRSAVANASDLLDEIVKLAAPQAGERWLEAACGPGIIARALSPHVAEVQGVDATAAMIELARREAERQQLENLHFEVEDATRLSHPSGSFDGCVARFALHHIPVPDRLLSELVRVTRPRGRVVIIDHVGDSDLDALAFTQEVERLRDPSHWASLPLERLRELGHRTGLSPAAERLIPLDLDFEDWLARGQASDSAQALVRRLVTERPQGTECFRLLQTQAGLTLRLQVWLAAWDRF